MGSTCVSMSQPSDLKSQDMAHGVVKLWLNEIYLSFSFNNEKIWCFKWDVKMTWDYL